jgi:hypothetical protein
VLRRVAVVLSVVIGCSSSGGDDDGAGVGGGSGSGGSAGSGTGGSAGTGGAAADTWESYAMGFFTSYCTECHGAGDAQRDYSTRDDVVRDKDTIRCGVGTVKYPGCAAFPPPSQFPIGTGPKPSDAERDRLVAWIEAGAL